jgi:hypothetical protein
VPADGRIISVADAEQMGLSGSPAGLGAGRVGRITGGRLT